MQALREIGVGSGKDNSLQKVITRSEFAELHLGKPFPCKLCRIISTPKAQQRIYHQLCDYCFEDFDAQKMLGRLQKMVLEKNIVNNFYSEDSDLWVGHKKSLG